MASVNTIGIEQQAEVRFTVGQIVHHRRFDYRGVVVDVDLQFNGTDAWYESVAKSRPRKDQPWYRILVDGAEQETYVAERHLEADLSAGPVSNSAVERVFARFENGRYLLPTH